MFKKMKETKSYTTCLKVKVLMQSSNHRLTQNREAMYMSVCKKTQKKTLEYVEGKSLA